MNQDRSSQSRPVASRNQSQTHSDATGLDCGDRSWICNAPHVKRLSFVPRAKARVFDGTEVPFKRMLSLYTREMLYLPTQIIAQRNTTGRMLNYVSRGNLQV